MNDLPPQSQPWVREVEELNQQASIAQARVRKNMATQQQATSTALASVTKMIPQLKTQVAGVQLISMKSSAVALGLMSGITNNAYRVASQIFIDSPGAVVRNASVFANAILTYNLTADQANLGRMRIGINGNYSPFAPLFSYGGINDGSLAYGANVTGTNRVIVSVEVMFPDVSNITDNSNPTYGNGVRGGATVSWS